MIPGELVREPVVLEIQREHTVWTNSGVICLSCLNHYRTEHVRHLLEDEKGELSALEKEVIRSVQEQESVSENVNQEFVQQFTFGQRLADRIAEFGGSRRFIVLFAVGMVAWIAVNSVVLLARPFDPFPFILLNRIIACQATIQAPIIMMSQNR